MNLVSSQLDKTDKIALFNFIEKKEELIKQEIRDFNSQMERYELHITDLKKTYLNLQLKHQSDINQYNINKEKYDKKATLLINLFINHFSESVINLIREKLDDNNFDEALQQIEELVFKGEDYQIQYLEDILNKCSINSDTNFLSFLNVFTIIYEMLEKFDTKISDHKKALYLENAIMTGTSTCLKEMYNYCKLGSFTYQDTINRLLSHWKKESRSPSSNSHSPTTSSSTTVTGKEKAFRTETPKVKCKECGKYHLGACKVEIRTGGAEYWRKQ
jgi:hypothetical protein